MNKKEEEEELLGLGFNYWVLLSSDVLSHSGQQIWIHVSK